MEYLKFIETVKASICKKKKKNHSIMKIFYSPHKENKPFLGTSRYASIAAHKG